MNMVGSSPNFYGMMFACINALGEIRKEPRQILFRDVGFVLFKSENNM